MFVALPLIALIALFLLTCPHTATLRGALLMALVAWGVLLTIITEGLSLFTTLTQAGLILAWGMVTLSLCMLLYRHGIHLPLHSWREMIRQTPLSLWIIFMGIASVIVLTGLVALLAAPGTWDAMAYHLPRVFFWEQFHRVAPFPTHVNRQLYQPPFAEFVMLHLQILIGSDALSNIGQWMAMLFCAIGVAKIAQQLGPDGRGQLLAAVLCVTLPIGIMQATGSKNDFVTALWVVCLTYFVLEDVLPHPPASGQPSQDRSPDSERRIAAPPGEAGRGWGGDKDTDIMPGRGGPDGRGRPLPYSRINLFQAISQPSALGPFFIGASAGLALLTKGTAYVYVVPLLAWWALALMRRAWSESSSGKRAQHAAPLHLSFFLKFILVTIVILLINAGHFLRNMSVYGSPLTAPSHSIYYANETFSPAVLISNTLRNLALHIYIPDQVNNRVNIGGAIFQVIESVHRLIGLDLNDTRTTFPWNEFEIPPIWQIFNEDRAGNPLHLGLLFLAMVAYPFLRKVRSSYLTIYLLAGISQFLLFSGLLKWQVWGTRLQLPFFVYTAPFMAVVLAALLHRYLTMLLQIGLLLLALFWVSNTSTRPIFSSTDNHPLALNFYIGHDNIDYESILTQPRLAQYFNAKSELLAPSEAAAARVKSLNCAKIGLISDESGLLYPLMMLLKADNPAVFMQAVNVDNETAFLSKQPSFNQFGPCAIVLMYGAQPRLPDVATIDGNSYRRIWANEAYEIFIPDVPTQQSNHRGAENTEVSQRKFSDISPVFWRSGL